MADTETRDRGAAGEVTITPLPAMTRLSLRSRDPLSLGKLLGCELPRKIGETLGHVACLGPDEWFFRSEKPLDRFDTGGMPVSFVDVSERSVGFVVEGHRAHIALNAGCPLDLERFPVGRMTRTVYDGVEIVILREGAARWSVDVWRSYADWLQLSLETAARHL